PTFFDFSTFTLKLLPVTQCGLPEGLQLRRDEPVLRVRGLVAPSCQFDFVARSLELEVPLFERLRVIRIQLLQRAQGDLDLRGRHGIQKYPCDRRVHPRSTEALASLAAVSMILIETSITR